MICIGIPETYLWQFWCYNKICWICAIFLLLLCCVVVGFEYDIIIMYIYYYCCVNWDYVENLKVTRIQSSFIRFGEVTSSRSRVTTLCEEDNEIKNINVLAYFNVNFHGSTRSTSNVLGLSYNGLQRNLKQRRKHALSMLWVQNLPGGNARRAERCKRNLIQIKKESQFLRKIIWSDESKFSEEGLKCKRN